MKKSNPQAVIYERMVRNALLKEASLTRTEIAKHPWRVDRFIERVKDPEGKFTVGNTQTPIGLRIIETGKPERDLDLTNSLDEQLVRNWIVGKATYYNILPTVQNDVISWSFIFKDPEMAQKNYVAGKSTIPEKFLTPVGLGIANGKIVTIKRIEDAITQNVQDSNLSNILLGLVEAAARQGGRIPEQTQSALATISDADKRAIIKDFGEVLAAIMTSNSKNGMPFYFPASVSNPLTDFALKDGENVYEYSVKSLSGSGSSLANYMKGIDQILQGESSPEEKIAAQNLKNAMTTNMQDRIIVLANVAAEADDNVSKIFAAIKASVPKLRNKEFTAENLFDATGSTPAAKIAAVTSFMGGGGGDRQISKDSINAAFLYPLASATVKAMNTNIKLNIYKNVIAKAANTMQVTQAYITFDNMKNPQNLTISSQEFVGVSSKDVEFVNKATSNSIAKGGIVIKISPKGVGNAAPVFKGNEQMESKRLINNLIKEVLALQ